MATLADLIEFLLGLLRDPQAQARFEDDPKAALADNGLEGVSAQDVRDARLLLADDGIARPVGDPTPPPTGSDPVEEVRFTAANFEADPAPPPPSIETTFVTIDDSDTLLVQNNSLSDDDVTIVNDSFNDQSSTDVVAIQAENSFNEGTGAEPVLDPAADLVGNAAEPVVNAAESVVNPAESVVNPAEPVVNPAEPVVNPAEPVVNPAEPVVNPDEGVDVSEDSAADDLPPDDGLDGIEPDFDADPDTEPVEEIDPTADAVVV